MSMLMSTGGAATRQSRHPGDAALAAALSGYRKSAARKRPLLVALAALTASVAIVPAAAADRAGLPAPTMQGWLMPTPAQGAVARLSLDLRKERAALAAIVAKRTPADIDRYRWWSVGGPVHRWNEIAVTELADGFVTLPLAARHLALLHAALDDAIAATGSTATAEPSPGPAPLDSALAAAGRHNGAFASPYAAATTAAAEILGYFLPARAAHLSARAEEAIAIRLTAGVDLPGEAEAGRAIGRKVAGLAIARGRADRADAKWTGEVPQGPGNWKGTNPIGPMAGTWQTWVLTSPSEFRPAAPPIVDSAETKSAIAELKAFPRGPKTNHRAVYWEVHGGVRAHTLWNDIARVKLLEAGAPAPVAARTLAAVNVALADAGIACWDAKYTYWYPRPAQLDPELKTVHASPNHPSFPSAHACFSSAASTVLAHVFALDRASLLALGKEAGEARIWAGIHYRFDVEAGGEIGRKVAQKTLARSFIAPGQ